MDEFSFDTFEELIEFMTLHDADDPVPRQTYLGYPHIVYDTMNGEYVYPCTVEIITAPDGTESMCWYRGKATNFPDEYYDFLGKEMPFNGLQGRQ